MRQLFGFCFIVTALAVIFVRSDEDSTQPEQVHLSLGVCEYGTAALFNSEPSAHSTHSYDGFSSNIPFEYHVLDLIHLQFGPEGDMLRGTNLESESDIVVTWVTQSPASLPVVQYGTTQEQTQSAYGVTKVFAEERTIYIHRVTLQNLQPDTQYYYACGSEDGMSQTFWFKTLPTGSEWSPRLNIYGDLGYENAVSVPRIQDDAQNHEIDLVIHVGDFAYDLDTDYGRNGDQFMNMIQPIAAHVPYMVAPGNHERHRNFSQYRERFSMPGETENLYFSFNVGPVHFVSVDTEAYWYYKKYGLDVAANQYEWLQMDLEEANENRAERPWIVMYGHRPMYCSSESEECNETAPTRSGIDIDGQLMYGIEPLLKKYGVDIAFWGHKHNYERLWPIYDNQVMKGSESPYVNPGAPVHITTGSAGCRERLRGFRWPIHHSSAFRSKEYGVTEVEFINATHMRLRQIETGDDNYNVVDDIFLVKEYHEPY